MVGGSQFDLNLPEDIKVQFRVDEKIAPGKFVPDPLIPGGYKANSLTLRAMKENIFVLGESLDDLTQEINCVSCSKLYDLQFWKCCPYCGKENKEC